MADQNAAAEQVAETDSSAQAETGTQQETAAQENWEQRFKDTQAWATSLAQQKAELEARAQVVADLESDDPEKYTAALRQLGFNVPEEETDEPQHGVDPEIRAKLAKIDEIDEWRTSLTESEKKEQHYAQYREQYDPKLTAMGVPKAFLESVADIAYNQLDAIQGPRGLEPDLEGAVAQFNEVAELFAEVPAVQQRAMKKWRETKPRQAFTQQGGAEGTEALDLTKHENRVGIALSRLTDQ